jgi:Flp pilus assembly protein CpaB
VSNRRTLMAAAAIVLALVAGIGVYLYASSADERAAENAGFVDALVANSDIAKGTTGEEVLQAGLVKKAKVARSSVPPSIVTDPNQLLGKVTSSNLNNRQFITTSTFASATDGAGGAFATAIGKQGLVAVSVNVDAERGVANQITPGDHVDIATTTDSGNGTTTTYLLQNVKVLAVGPSTALQTTPTAADGSAQQPGLLTFEVTPEDALRVIAANAGNTKIYLVLLPPGVGSNASSGGTKTPAASKAP